MLVIVERSRWASIPILLDVVRLLHTSYDSEAQFRENVSDIYAG